MRSVIVRIVFGIIVAGGMAFGAREVVAGGQVNDCPNGPSCDGDNKCGWLAPSCGMSPAVCLMQNPPHDPNFGCCVCWNDM